MPTGDHSPQREESDDCPGAPVGAAVCPTRSQSEPKQRVPARSGDLPGRLASLAFSLLCRIFDLLQPLTLVCGSQVCISLQLCV